MLGCEARSSSPYLPLAVRQVIEEGVCVPGGQAQALSLLHSMAGCFTGSSGPSVTSIEMGDTATSVTRP